MKQILVILYGGGLGNRINVLLSALSFFHRYSYPMTILWYNDVSFNCNFEDIFQPIQGINITIISHKSGSLDTPLEVFNLDFEPFPNRLIICKTGNKEWIQPLYTFPATDSFLCSNDCIFNISDIKYPSIDPSYIESFDTLVFLDPNIILFPGNFKSAADLFVKYFVPISISSILNFYTSHKFTKAVHLRLTDKIKVNQYDESNLENDIHNIFSNNHDITFICSDNLITENAIVKRYSNCFCFLKNHQVFIKDTFIIREKNSCTEAIIDYFIFCACPVKQGINSNEWNSSFFQSASLLHSSFCIQYNLIQ